jgi:hypothetical protein
VHRCATWRRYIPDVEGDESWGPTEEELVQCLIQRRTAGRGEDGFEEDNGGDDDLEDFETLDALDNADVYHTVYDEMDGENTDYRSTDSD